MYWNFFLFAHFTGYEAIGFTQSWYEYGLQLIIFYGGYLFIPFIGLLSDVWIGRYRAITVGIGLCFSSWIIGGILFYTQFFHDARLFFWIIYGSTYLMESTGYTCFRINIIQYNID